MILCDLWIVKVDIPVHPATKWFVLRMTTATETVVLPRSTSITRLIIALPIFERNATSNAIWSVLGDLDGWCALLVNLVTGFDAAYCVTERTGRTGTYGTNNLVHPCTTWGNKRLLTD